MSSLLFRVMIFLCGLWGVLIVLVMTLPDEDTQAQDFMGAAENCEGACLLGIQAGITRVDEAMRQLQANDWVNDVQMNTAGNGYSQITWGWSEHQPEVIDDTHQGRITFFWEDDNIIPLGDSLVETITIYTHMRHFSLQQWAGQTDSSYAALRPDGKIGYSALYNVQGGTLNLYVELACPFRLMAYWDAQTRITISIGHSTNAFVQPSDLAGLCPKPER